MSRISTQLKGLIPFLALPLFWGCRDDPTGPGPILDPDPGMELVIAPAEASLVVGEDLQLELLWRDRFGSYEVKDADVLWTSDHPEIASVGEDGVLHALAPGTTRIWAHTLGSGPQEADGGERASALVEVGES